MSVTWEGPDDSGWTWADSPGGGILIVRPLPGGSWAAAWAGSSGHVLWRASEPLPTREAAQRAAEAEVRRAVDQYAAQQAAEAEARR